MSPVFIFTTENAGGVCIGRLRGSQPTSTLIPDVDHAAVGNAFAPFTGGFHIRDPPVFSYPPGKEETRSTFVAD